MGRILKTKNNQIFKNEKCDFSAEEKPRRVLVLANVTANGRHCYDDFVKNALPLLHLAGLQVDIVKVFLISLKNFRNKKKLLLGRKRNPARGARCGDGQK